VGETLIDINDRNFESAVVGSSLPVLVDFSAEWCGPCKKLAPIVQDLAREYQGRLKVGHLDIEASPATAAQFGVMSVPTLIFFRDGRQAGHLVGGVSRRQLEEAIRKVIG